MRKTFLIFMLFLCALGLYAQVDLGGMPPTFRYDKTKMIPEVSVKIPEHRIDKEKLLREEIEAESLGLPPRVAVSVPVDYSPENAGQWDLLPDGTLVWRLALQLPDALALIVSYHDFYLPEGTSLYLYNPTRTRVLGAYRHGTNPEGGSFSTEMLPGDAVIFELQAPAGMTQEDLPAFLQEMRLQISGLGYCFNKISVRHLPGMSAYGAKTGESEWCTINVNCEEGEDWQITKKSVCKMLMYVNFGWYLCTGTVLNNTAEDVRPYIASAYHCLSGGDPATIDFSQWQFIFDYEAPGCEDEEPSDIKTMTGCRYRVGIPQAGGSDGMLLELTEQIPESWNVYYSGWDRRDVLPSDSIAINIHHPAGDIKKISRLEELAVDYWPMRGSEGDTNAHIRVIYGETVNGRSVTEGGSSGSGMFNGQHRLIATLTGGNTSCDVATGNGYYGRLWYHWDQYGTDSTTQFAYWLDPLKTGAETMDGTWIDPTAPRLDLSRTELSEFRTEDYNEPSASDTFYVKTANLTEPVYIRTTAPFEVSGNGTDYALVSQRDGSGSIHVRYNPKGIRRDTAWVYLYSSGSDTAKVRVLGNSCMPLYLNPEELPNAYVGTPYHVQLQASGTEADYLYEIVSGRLPQGLTLASDGMLDGTPEEFGLFRFSVQVAEPQLCDQIFERSLYVVCEVVDRFPFTESFEDGSIPSCWTQEYVKDRVDWRFTAGTDNPESSVNAAQDGSFNALFRAETYDGYATKLITPQLDLSGLSHPELSFHYAQPVWITDQDMLKVYVKNAATAPWQELLFFEGDIPQWQDTSVLLPDPSAEYFVAFEGISYFGYGTVVDNVRIAEGTVANQPAVCPESDFLVCSNPVRDVLYVDIDISGPAKITVRDLAGRCVLEKAQAASREEIDMKGIPAGLYTVTVQAGSDVQTVRIVKM